MVEKNDLSVVSYSLGIISIVMAIFTPLAGLVFGVVGFVLGKKLNTELSKKAKKLNIIGIIISAIIFIVSVAVAVYLSIKGIDNPLTSLQ